MASPLQSKFSWDTWDLAQGTALAGPEWIPSGFMTPTLTQATGVYEGSLLASRAHSAPVGIDGFDIHSNCVAPWQINTGVMGFLPEG